MDTQLIEAIAPWVCSAVTVLSMWQYGNIRRLGPALGLLSQIGWWAFTLAGPHWGLVPINVAMLFIHTRNLRKWSKRL